MSKTEINLVRAAQRGDRSAMAGLYSRNVGYLAAVCSRYIPDKEDRDDVLQNSFVKIFSSIGKFEYRGPGSLKAWMTRIAVNESVNYLKSQGKTGRLDDSNAADIPQDDGPEVDNIPQDVILKMIQGLPDGYRTVFNLFVFEEKSHREIAQMLGISESTSASQFHRARAILAKEIQKYRESTEN